MNNKTRICQLIGSIFFHGNFRAETENERELETLLRQEGFFFESEDQLLNKLRAPKEAGSASLQPTTEQSAPCSHTGRRVPGSAYYLCDKCGLLFDF